MRGLPPALLGIFLRHTGAEYPYDPCLLGQKTTPLRRQNIRPGWPALASGPVIHIKKRLQKRCTAEVGCLFWMRYQ